MNKLTKIQRILIAIASLSLIATYFVPIWRIDLFAPQYPEGLTMKIWLNDIKGEIDIINGLNHYIGMRKINVDMFPEFAFLGYVVAFYIVLGLIIAIIGKRKILFWYIVFTLFGGLFAMYDYYRWGYEYGHNLDPTAPIKIPGLSYQPPIIGHKRLLNFDAYSFPDIGGWVVIGAASIMFLVWFYDWYKTNKKRKSLSAALATSIVLFTLSSCNAKPEPLKIGTDICYLCKMGITDTKFGGEIITDKSKIYKFDDLGCMIRFMKGSELDKKNIASTWAMNFEKPNEFIEVNKAVFAASPLTRSPMGFNLSAFSHQDGAAKVVVGTSGKIFTWKELYQQVD
jgi:copper chaperone NosL